MNVNGKKMNHLRFVDDIVIISEKAEETEEMVSDQRKQESWA